jgi:2'-5' RNA ligase
VRWVRDAGLHLTLKFLGEVAEDRVPAVEEAFVGACAGTPRLTLSVREFGAFPSTRRPKILWAGFGADPALELLAHRIEQQFESLGFPVEGRPFRPHVTLGRIKEGTWLPVGAAAELEEARPAATSLADRAVLFESRLGPGGALHRAVREVPLGS